MGFTISGNAANGNYEIHTELDINYDLSEIIINSRINTNTNINIVFKIYINDSLIYTFGSYNLNSSLNYYSIKTSIDTSIDNTVKIQIISTKDGIYNNVEEQMKSEIIPKYNNDKIVESYNKKYDKITESEVVYDFVERLKLGKDLIVSDSKLLYSDTKLINALSGLLMINPWPQNINDIRMIKFVVPEGMKSISATIIGNVSNYDIYRVYTDKSRLDISNAFDKNINGNVFTVKSNFDCPYPSNDIINLLIKVN